VKVLDSSDISGTHPNKSTSELMTMNFYGVFTRLEVEATQRDRESFSDRFGPPK
jgi:hypothetical protein